MSIPKYECLWIFLIWGVLNAHAQFTEITNSQGVLVINTGTYDGNGTSFKDFNSDGWDDITFGTVDGMPRFFQNNMGTLGEVYFDLPNHPSAQIKGLQWVDFDNDADQDLFLAYSGAPVKLYRNNGTNNFEDISASAGLTEEYVDHFGSAWADTDNDGFLDLYISKYTSIDDAFTYEYTNRFYHNNGDGTFSDYTVVSNLDGVIQSCFQPVFFDYDKDNFLDLYILIDRHVESNIMFHNNGDGTFSNVSVMTGTDIAIDAMGGSFDDYDNDGDIDIYISNGYDGNVLMRNNNNGTFTDVSPYYDMQVYNICWGDMWMDYNNDTHKDLWVSTTINNWESAQNLFFVNNANNTFTEDIYTTGISGDVDPTFSCSMGDLNKDGYYDFITSNNDPRPASLWQNTPGVNNFLSVTLTGTLSNRDAIGTFIDCYTDGHYTVNHVANSENYLGQNAQREIFGLAQSTVVDSLIIHWPSGLIEKYYDIEAPAYKHFIEGAQEYSQMEIQVDGDLILCQGDSLELSCPEGSGFIWSNGEQSQNIVISEPGVYFVQSIHPFGFIIQSDTIVVLEEPAPAFTAQTFNVSCFNQNDGSIILDVDESTTIEWSSGASGPTLSDLATGWYIYTLYSTMGCSMKDSLFVDQPDELLLSVESTDVTCFEEDNGTATLEIVGGTEPYVVDWGGINPGQLSSDSYCVSVIDQALCEASTCFEIEEPPLLIVDVSTTPAYQDGPPGSASLIITGGTAPYSIVWSNGIENSSELSNLAAGIYSVLVTDDHECTYEVVFTIDWIVNTPENCNMNFSVYPSPFDDQLILSLNGKTCEIKVCDVSGRMVANETSNGNAHKLNTRDWNPGVYILYVRSTDEASFVARVQKCPR